jgi:hypothetical protein
MVRKINRFEVTLPIYHFLKFLLCYRRPLEVIGHDGRAENVTMEPGRLKDSSVVLRVK